MYMHLYTQNSEDVYIHLMTEKLWKSVNQLISIQKIIVQNYHYKHTHTELYMHFMIGSLWKAINPFPSTADVLKFWTLVH